MKNRYYTILPNGSVITATNWRQMQIKAMICNEIGYSEWMITSMRIRDLYTDQIIAVLIFTFGQLSYAELLV